MNPTRARAPEGIPPAQRGVTQTTIQAWRDGSPHTRADTLVGEEPLEIRLAGYSVTVTMRTPGDDFDLAAGLLFTEGVIESTEDIASITYCPTDDPESADNIVNINPVDPSMVQPERWRRNFVATSSCGICGKAQIEQVRRRAAPLRARVRIPYIRVYELGMALRGAQSVFETTGGLHAAAVFDVRGELMAIREDVGRHNAVDKVIGGLFRQGHTPLADHMLVTSSRGSFEIVQKALVAGIPIVATVSAPSSLAVELAREAGMTLIGFLRPESGETGRFNVYAGEERLEL